jgi:hypothetical protein
MPFELLPTVPTAQHATHGSISYKRNSRSRNKKSPPRLIICVPRSLNNGSIERNDRISLLIGTGSDAGKAKLAKAKDGALARVLRGGAILLRFGYVPMLGIDPAEREAIEVRPNGDGFEFDLPPWFKGKV